MKFALVFVALLSFQAVSAGLDVNSMARKYLNKYRYLAPSYERGGNHDFTSAIKQMQRFAHIPQTGVVDAATFRLMHTPRCGMPDKSQGKSNRARRYSTNIADRHSQNNLKYYVQYGADLSADLQDQIFATAFQHWAKVSSLTFSQTSILNDANLLISFGSRNHTGTAREPNCTYPFDGEGGTLAHAALAGAMAHFDEDETFTHNSYDGVNLLWVAVHEFGHNLGLDHSDVQGAIMYPYYTGYDPKIALHSDDIKGVQSLYGPLGGTMPPTPPTPPPPCVDDVPAEWCTGDACSSSSEMRKVCRRTCGVCTA
ncbi:50 kDa hatching enzyme isoform X1 [Nematostella vectensis]|uniref:50 kDa hatching enzyme isoform X1 n=1 Tax=Nematostella vectensis TaxID=45351 RepID=UPI002077353C|nr:50 kDa hatching enzyme isoform X1 [Nematostella vectensis]